MPSRLRKSASCKLNRISVGDARRLEYDSHCTDAVLYFGPLYHLTEARERAMALKEAGRVLRPGGVLLAVYISRFASLIDALLKGWLADDSFHSIILEDLTQGQHRNPTGNPAYFTDAYFHHPVEAEEELRKSGFREVKLVTLEGPFWTMPDIDTKICDRQLANRVLDLAETIESEETLLGVGAHFVACARKCVD